MTTTEFIERLDHEASRLARLQCLLNRKQDALREARLKLRMGYDPDEVSRMIVRVIKDELLELDVKEEDFTS